MPTQLIPHEGRRVLACPDCGSTIRRYSITVSETVVVRESVKYKAKHSEGGRPFQEGFAGASHFKLTDEWHDVQRTIDRQNDWYDEVVRGPHGDVIHEVHEPLSEHTEHGSAKRRSESETVSENDSDS